MIYLASPYTDRRPYAQFKRFKLVRKAHDILMTIEREPVFSPILIGHECAERGLKWSHAQWMEWSLNWLGQCSKLWVLPIDGWDISSGVRMEVELAAARGLSITACDVIDEADQNITGALIRRHFQVPSADWGPSSVSSLNIVLDNAA